MDVIHLNKVFATAKMRSEPSSTHTTSIHTHNTHAKRTQHSQQLSRYLCYALGLYRQSKNTMQSKYKVFDDIATDGTANQIHTICTTDI